MASTVRDEPHHWLHALFYESPVAIGFSRDGTMLDANAVYLATFGYERVEQLRGTSLLLQIAPSHRAEIIDKVARRAQGEAVATSYLTRGLRRNGDEFPFEINTCRVTVPDGPLTIAFIRDVSDRERSSAEVSAALEMFRTLASAAIEGVYVHEAGKITLVNEAGATLVGATPEQLIGRSVLDLCTTETRPRVEASIAASSNEPFEVVAQRLDGGQLPVEIRPRVLMHQGRATRISVVRDLSERKKAEAERAILDERVRRSDKLESLGTLAAGVAHDFNNILTIIMTEAAVARGLSKAGRSVSENLIAIEQASERAAELCRQMLAYSGRAHIRQQPINLSALVADMGAMLEAAVGRRANLHQELAAGLASITGDATQLRQVLLNLVINACEAVTSPACEIRIRTGSGYVGSPSASGDELPAGDYAWFEVIDSGSGMDATTVARMFDPFFSTKFMGRGLGMAAVLGIVRGHRGAIDVDSQPGRGTRIRISLPITGAAEIVETARVEHTPESELRGSGLVLVVEDEPGIRRVTEVLLRGAGFDVVVAADGAAGLEAFELHAGRVRAVLMDLAMPGMDGVSAAAEIRRRAPGLPIVLLTGNASARPNALAESGANELLEKPVAASHLLAVLRRVSGAEQK